MPSPIFIGQLCVYNVITRVNDLRYIIAIVPFFFYLISILTDERAYLIQIGCPSALSVCEAV
jgi:hypothetical protein